MGGLVDSHKEVGNCWGWQHAHNNPAELLGNDVSKLHAVSMHHKGECFKEWCLGGENPYLLKISGEERYSERHKMH